jgi:hypothetical protein
VKPLNGMAPHRVGRIFVATLLASGACALHPAARVAHSSPPEKPPAEVPMAPGVEERVVARTEPPAPAFAAESTSTSGEIDEGDAKPAPSRARKPPKRAPAAAKSPEPSPAQTPEAPSPDAPARAQRAAFERPPSLDVDARTLDAERCGALLREHGVEFEVKEGASPEHLYVKPKGHIGGIHYAFEGRREVHEVMDCRLVVALLQWAPALRSEGVRKIRHLSAYRPDARVAASGKRSGHASALAIDVRFLELEDGRTLDVLTDWGNRTRGVMPCEEGVGDADPNPDVRRITCELVGAGLFQTVITPHRDQLHENHVHLELVPEVDWTFIR